MRHMQTHFPKVHCEKVDIGKFELLKHQVLFLNLKIPGSSEAGEVLL